MRENSFNTMILNGEKGAHYLIPVVSLISLLILGVDPAFALRGNLSVPFCNKDEILKVVQFAKANSISRKSILNKHVLVSLSDDFNGNSSADKKECIVPHLSSNQWKKIRDHRSQINKGSLFASTDVSPRTPLNLNLPNPSQYGITGAEDRIIGNGGNSIGGSHSRQGNTGGTNGSQTASVQVLNDPLDPSLTEYSEPSFRNHDRGIQLLGKEGCFNIKNAVCGLNVHLGSIVSGLYPKSEATPRVVNNAGSGWGQANGPTNIHSEVIQLGLQIPFGGAK